MEAVLSRSQFRWLVALLLVVIILILLVANPVTINTAGADPRSGIPFACDHAPTLDGIPCSEVDRAVGEAANEFRIDHATFRNVIECESHYEPVTGGFYEGLTQQSQEFFNRWAPRFNRDVVVDLGDKRPYASRQNPFDNARLGAYVIRWYTNQGRPGYTEWGRCA